MKSTFKLGSIEIQGVKLNNIEFTQEYTATEAISLMSFGKKFVRELIKEIPDMMDDVAKAQEKLDTLGKEFAPEQTEKPEMPEHIKALISRLGINPEHVQVREL